MNRHKITFKYPDNKSLSTLSRFEKALLRMLLKNGNEMNRDSLVHSFPDEKFEQANDALLRLVQLGFVTLKYIGEECLVVLPKIRQEEAWTIVDPEFVLHKGNTPKRELIPKDYVPEPFHIFYGEKEIRHAVSEYWLCRKVKDKDFIACFIFNSDGTKSSITLGRLEDSSSLVSRYLDEIDMRFPDRSFLKKELVHKLPKSLTGNRQPIKAVTEYLCLEGYLEKIGKSRFKRTPKLHIVDSLDRITEKVTKPISWSNGNGKPVYYYTDEEGLYPNLS